MTKLTSFDIIVFLRQLATLITAGVPIKSSLELLASSQEKIVLKQIIFTIKQDIAAGKPLSHSLQTYKKYFDAITCQLIQIGEHTGRLDTMLETIANHQEKNWAIQQRIQQALFYPAIITTTAIIVTLCLFIFIVPRFAQLFHGAHIKLPWLTRCLFFFAAKLHQHGILLSSVLLCGIGLLYQHRHRLLHYLPFMHIYRQKILAARFARYLAMTYAAGIPINIALTLAADACGNTEFSSQVIKLNHKIRAGWQLHTAMQSLPHFLPLLIQMVKIGEESGMLTAMLQKTADFFAADVERLVNRLCTLLEPLIMIILGVLIGGLVIAMYLPIFNLGSVF